MIRKNGNKSRNLGLGIYGYIEQIGPTRRATTVYYRNRGFFRKEEARPQLAVITVVKNVKPETRFLLKKCA